MGHRVLAANQSCGQTYAMAILKHSESIVIARSPEDLYDLVSDITRMGTWSPICQACWWDEGDRPRGWGLVHRKERAARANLGDKVGGRRC